MGRVSRLALSGIGLGLATTALAAQPTGTRPSREFAQAAAQADQFEIMEADSVLALSKNPHIRAFAEQMRTVHLASRARLLSAADAAGVAPPLPGISNDQAQLLAALQSQHEEGIDRVYAQQQYLAHQANLATIVEYAASGDAPPLRQEARDDALVIEQHLEMARRLLSEVPPR